MIWTPGTGYPTVTIDLDQEPLYIMAFDGTFKHSIRRPGLAEVSNGRESRENELDHSLLRECYSFFKKYN